MICWAGFSPLSGLVALPELFSSLRPALADIPVPPSSPNSRRNAWRGRRRAQPAAAEPLMRFQHQPFEAGCAREMPPSGIRSRGGIFGSSPGRTGQISLGAGVSCLSFRASWARISAASWKQKKYRVTQFAERAEAPEGLFVLVPAQPCSRHHPAPITLLRALTKGALWAAWG